MGSSSTSSCKPRRHRSAQVAFGGSWLALLPCSPLVTLVRPSQWIRGLASFWVWPAGLSSSSRSLPGSLLRHLAPPTCQRPSSSLSTTWPISSTRSPSCWHAGLAQRVTQKLAARVNHSLLEHISRSSLRRDAFSTSSRSLVRPIFLAHCWALVPPDRDYRRWWLR